MCFVVCCLWFVVVCSRGGVPSFVRMTILGGGWSVELEVMRDCCSSCGVPSFVRMTNFGGGWSGVLE